MMHKKTTIMGVFLCILCRLFSMLWGCPEPDAIFAAQDAAGLRIQRWDRSKNDHANWKERPLENIENIVVFFEPERFRWQKDDAEEGRGHDTDGRKVHDHIRYLWQRIGDERESEIGSANSDREP